LDELKKIAGQAGLKVRQMKILNNVILWAELISGKKI